MRLLTFALLATGCGDSGDSKSPDDPGMGDDTGTGSVVYVDEDRDGYFADEDCDDNDYRVYPGAEEICDGKDNDCNDETDEGFDQDGDGALSMELCETIGTDCDDADPAFPAEEIPYDGVDQDCDGSDLADIDGDGYPGRAGGGNDCDDEEASIHPGAAEVPRDGIDQNCDGVDLIDGDDDGFESVEFGGTDCDDADPAVNPDAIDWFGDGEDSDCDEVDGGVVSAANAHAVIGGDPGTYALLGHDMVVCDLDTDGKSDLVVTAPYDGDYNGAVGVFYGRNVDDWSGHMTLDQAGTSLRSRATAWGFGVACADVDGDGRDDLLIGQGELQFGPFVSDYSVHVIYGVGGTLPGRIDDTDVDATLSIDLGAFGGVGDVHAGMLTATDLTGDGAAEIIVDHNAEGTEFGPSALWVIPGASYTGMNDMEAAIIASIADPQGDTVTALSVDGFSVAVGQEGYRAGLPLDASDPDSYAQTGKVAVMGVVAGEFDSISDAADVEFSLDSAGGLGHSVDLGDFDSDGKLDVGIGAPMAAAGGGAVYLLSDVGGFADGGGTATAAMDAIDAAAEASHVVVGTAGLGVGVSLGGDMDGDGVADVLVSEESGEGVGAVWMVSGALLADGENALADVAVMGVRAQYMTEDLGGQLAVADFDGDGIDDLVMTSSHYPTPASVGLAPSGRVSIFLSSRY